jgi:hypothetical protein
LQIASQAFPAKSNMRKILVNLFLITLVGFQLNCAKYTTADNSNQANADLPAAETVQANANANAVAEETPVPTFTSADEALASAKCCSTTSKRKKRSRLAEQAVKLIPDFSRRAF